MNDVLATAVGAIIGGLVTWIVAHLYYQRASVELKEEAQKLRRLSKMILRWLELKGENVGVVRDEEGEILGLARQIGVTEGMTNEVTPQSGTLGPPDTKNGD